MWTSDPKRGRAVATRLQAGTVNINEGYAAAWASVDAPMGGMKASGLGRRHGAQGILKYTEPQTIAIERGLPVGVPSWMRADHYARLMSGGLRVLRRLPGVK
ncbi:aldehyde dehydrogenase family protein [Mycobacterium kansasii]|uniref:Aldehyde dehydrogenase family protein n=1 Tax=Mycobacterium kansasii TaxID=1768 RepID=A0A1V3XAF8_MYCKA|nr:aldehyde dehydrogenase family protein [Mycobacterium kansasii]